jgi:hypothetical protein
MLLVFKCNECFIESKKKNGFIGQASEAPILKLIKIAIKADIKKNNPKPQVNLFLKLINRIKTKITKTELLFIGISYNCQESNFKTNNMESNPDKILVIILSNRIITQYTTS